MGTFMKSSTQQAQAGVSVVVRFASQQVWAVLFQGMHVNTTFEYYENMLLLLIIASLKMYKFCFW